MAAQYSFVMKGLTKAFPGPEAHPQQHPPAILPDAKIGIVGPNGSGKSTLMKIMAGSATRNSPARRGRARGSPSAISSRSRSSTRPRRSARMSWTACGPSPTCSTASTRSRAQMADPGDDFDALMAEMGELQEKIDAVDGWTLDNQLEIAMDALRCPPGECVGRQPLRRREAPGRADPAAARKARHPAPRRADQPPRRRERPVARKASDRLSRQRHPRHPRPLFPRQCRQLDPRARSRALLRLRRKLLHLSGKEGKTTRAGRARGGRQAEGDRGRAGMDPALAQGAPGQVQGPHQGLRRAGQGAGEPRSGQGRDPDPDARAARRQCDRRQRRHQRPMATSCCSRI